jgi:hypothetical protein
MSETSPTPAASGGPPPTVDLQDPLPESSWLWRRVFVFALSAAFLAFLWYYSGTLAEVARSVDANTPKEATIAAIERLFQLLRGSLIIIGVLILAYLFGASMEQLTRLVQTAKTLRSGNVSFRSASSASSPDGARADAETIIAPVPAPKPAPPPPAPAASPAAPPPARADTVTFPWEKDQ